MEQSYRSAERGRSNIHTLPRSTPIKDSSGIPGTGPSMKPPNLNLSEVTRNGFHANNRSKENLTDGNEVCESPSYLTSGTMYSYGADVAGNVNSTSITPLSLNPVPLPPRDRLRTQTLPNQKRHVRKHALIIPATGTLRTLDKLGSNHLSEENRLRLRTVADKSKMDMHTDTNLNMNSDNKIKFSALAKLQVVESAPQSPSHLIYQNFSMIPEVPNASDTASLDFETIVERKDLNHVNDVSGWSESGNGFLLERSASLVAATVDCDRVDGVIVQSDANGEGGATATTPIDTEDPPVLSNSVSCEDLLEFSEKKPNGRERGAESDEVRIMIKVLGPKVRESYCD